MIISIVSHLFMVNNIRNTILMTDNIWENRMRTCKIKEEGTIFHIKVEMDPTTHHIS